MVSLASEILGFCVIPASRKSAPNFANARSLGTVGTHRQLEEIFTRSGPFPFLYSNPSQSRTRQDPVLAMISTHSLSGQSCKMTLQISEKVSTQGINPICETLSCQKGFGGRTDHCRLIKYNR